MAAIPRVTRRCLRDDLGFADADATRPLTELATKNPLLKAFLERRAQNPEGQEAIQGLTSRIVAYSLHSGNDRGITWHHGKAGIVWLLAARFHRSGQRGDAYPFFIQLDKDDQLLPTLDDYKDFTHANAANLAESILSEVPPLRERARSSPGEIQQELIGGRVRVRLVFEDGDEPMLTVAISQRLRPGETQVPPDWQIRIAAAFLPGTLPTDLSFASDLAGDPLEDDEVCYCNFIED